MGGRQGQGKWGVDSMTALKQASRPPLKKNFQRPWNEMKSRVCRDSSLPQVLRISWFSLERNRKKKEKYNNIHILVTTWLSRHRNFKNTSRLKGLTFKTYWLNCLIQFDSLISNKCQSSKFQSAAHSCTSL